jgi:hypothetical protein
MATTFAWVTCFSKHRDMPERQPKEVVVPAFGDEPVERPARVQFPGHGRVGDFAERRGYLDLRRLEPGFEMAERIVEMLQPYLASPHLSRIVIDVRGVDPLPAAVETLIASVEAQALAHGGRLDVLHAPAGLTEQPG